MLDTGEATVLIIGMGRVGTELIKSGAMTGESFGIELNDDRALDLRNQGFNVEVADAMIQTFGIWCTKEIDRRDDHTCYAKSHGTVYAGKGFRRAKQIAK